MGSLHPPPGEYPSRGAPRSNRRFLQLRLAEGWRFAQRTATDLSHEIRHLAWRERAAVLDGHFLHQAEAMLRAETLSRLVGREAASLGEPPPASEAAARTERFASWSRAIVTAVLLELDEPTAIAAPEQALTFLLSQHPRFARALARWSARHGRASLEAPLAEHPGYALVLLAASPDDTAARFVARDAFWAAVTGHA